MDTRHEIREFLTSRRARISPDAAGLPPGGRRRVPGLRRAEVATLAGVSVEYYSRLERGDAAGVSDGVIDAIGRVLGLDEAERAHLVDLLRAAGRPRPLPAASASSATRPVRPALRWMLDAMDGAPAVVLGPRLDVVATNRFGAALFAPLLDGPGPVHNNARFVFLDPQAPVFFPDWDTVAGDTVAILRIEAGRRAYDRRLAALVGELSTRSDEFRTRWGAHDVRLHTRGSKRLNHPVVGDLDLVYETFVLPGDAGQSLSVYTAEPGSRSRQALHLLASWTSPAPASL